MKKINHLIHIVLMVALVVFAGCATDGSSGGRLERSAESTARQNEFREEIAALNKQLIGLGTQVDRAEAHRVAETAVLYSQTLAAKYRAVRPAVWHNLLVRMGARERGLCYHWTTDLMRRLQALGLTSFELYWGVAHQGSELREHNSVVIAATGRSFESGIVLDPWRNSGDLYWASVPQDRYPWRELPRELWF